jgi:aspartokinase/homoserine dehydrogenase 1
VCVSISVTSSCTRMNVLGGRGEGGGNTPFPPSLNEWFMHVVSPNTYTHPRPHTHTHTHTHTHIVSPTWYQPPHLDAQYVGSIDAATGKIGGGLVALPSGHCLFASKRDGIPVNAVAFHTDRYRDAPLLMQGPVAGSSFVASALLSDLLRFAGDVGGSGGGGGGGLGGQLDPGSPTMLGRKKAAGGESPLSL